MPPHSTVTTTSQPTAASFNSIQSGITGAGAWVTPRVMDPTNPNILYTGTNLVYRSTNSGGLVDWQFRLRSMKLHQPHRGCAVRSGDVTFVTKATTVRFSKTNDTGANW
ncbi:MAG: hypothetical protein IPP40_15305 [bacterium]|nr:hypothetical protein [bacterium]